MILHFYTLRCNHHPMASNHRSPYQVTIALMPFLVLCLQLCGLLHNKFVQLTLLHTFHPSLWQPPVYSHVSMSLFLKNTGSLSSRSHVVSCFSYSVLRADKGKSQGNMGASIINTVRVSSSRIILTLHCMKWYKFNANFS